MLGKGNTVKRSQKRVLYRKLHDQLRHVCFYYLNLFHKYNVLQQMRYLPTVGSKFNRKSEYTGPRFGSGFDSRRVQGSVFCLVAISLSFSDDSILHEDIYIRVSPVEDIHMLVTTYYMESTLGVNHQTRRT